MIGAAVAVLALGWVVAVDPAGAGFTASTISPASTWSAGTVARSDNDGGTAQFNASAAYVVATAGIYSGTLSALPSGFSSAAFTWQARS